MATKTKMERVFEQIEPNLLNCYEEVYPLAVDRVATALRPRFESGELRGWCDGDGDLRRVLPPMWRIERECARRFITSPLRALAVLQYSAEVANVEEWLWNRSGAGTCLLGAAESAMARDVLQLARERGWSDPVRGEEPAFAHSAGRAA